MTHPIISSFYIQDIEIVPAPRVPHHKFAVMNDPRSQRYFACRQEIAWRVKMMWKRPMIKIPCTFLAEVSLNHNRKCDWDNIGKTISDALQYDAKILENDSLIESGHVTILRGQKIPYLAVILYEGVIRDQCLADLVKTRSYASQTEETSPERKRIGRLTNGAKSPAGTAKPGNSVK